MQPVFRLLALFLMAGPLLAEPKSVPRVQALPLPHHEISLQRDGVELARYHYGPDLKRPFVYPIIGPSGRSLTRMGHPHDPESHRHHNSVWIAHQFVGGTNFWEDAGGNRIAHLRLERLEDGAEAASVWTVNAWTADHGRVLMMERRRTGVQLLGEHGWMLLIDLQLEAPGREEIELGKTAFGLVGVRVAKTIGVNDGGGTIRNSEGAVNEKEVFWKPARWVDYSGPITDQASEGVTLFDHPKNPNHPAVFHVRDDGWMGAALTFNGPRRIKPGERLRLRYGLFVHAGMPATNELQERWVEFTRLPLPEWPATSRRP